MKKILSLVMVMCVVIAMTACSGNTSMSFTFAVDTGDNVKLELDTTGGYLRSANLPFAISHDDDILSQGTFVVGDAYAEYLELIESDDTANVIDSGEKNGFAYTMWNYADKEFNYVIQLSDDTAMVIGNNVSEESARECFDRLTISLVEK